MAEIRFPEGTTQGDYLIAEELPTHDRDQLRLKVIAEGGKASWLFPSQIGNVYEKNRCFRAVHGHKKVWFIQPVDPGNKTKPVMPEFTQHLRDQALIALAWTLLVNHGVNGPKPGTASFDRMFADGYITTSDMLKTVNDLLTMSEIELRESGRDDLAEVACKPFMKSVRLVVEDIVENGRCHPDGCPYRDIRRGDLPFPDPMERCTACGKMPDHGMSEKDYKNQIGR